MRYTITNTRKPYTSPELSIHELRFEGVMQGLVSGHGSGQPFGAPRLKKINKGVANEDEYLDEGNELSNYNVSPVKL